MVFLGPALGISICFNTLTHHEVVLPQRAADRAPRVRVVHLRHLRQRLERHLVLVRSANVNAYKCGVIQIHKTY